MNYDKNEDIIHYLKEIAESDDQQSFRVVYDYYYNRLFRQALYYLNNNPDYAQEVVSNVFVALWQGRKVLDKVSNPDSYFFISLKHAVSRYVEQNYRRNRELLTENLPDIVKDNEDSDSNIRNQELVAKYKTALNNLPPRCAEVFRLVREEHKKYSEVAELLGISIKTVDNQMGKATKMLYEQLKENIFFIFF